MGRTIRTCSLLGVALAAMLAGAAPVEASRASVYRPTGATTFVGARAAELAGDARRAAILYATLAAAEPDNRIVADRAISQAISAGDMVLALRLAGNRPPATLAIDARLALAAERLRNGRAADAAALLRLQSRTGSLDFLAPLVEAWALAERRKGNAADLLARVPAGTAITPYLDEQRALILLRLKRGPEAEPLARKALQGAGGREAALRIAFADGYMRLRDRERALSFLDGEMPAVQRARALVQQGRRPGGSIDTAAAAFAHLLTGLAIDLNRGDSRALPISMVQVARHADAGNGTAPVLLGLLLGQDGRSDDALVVLRRIDDNSLFASEARDAEVRALVRADRLQEALARAQVFAQDRAADAGDWGRLGDVLDEVERYGEAADAYSRAIALVEAGRSPGELWQLRLLRGAMLEQADRWPEAKAELEAARALAPRNAMVLNYLGYARLERGEDLDASEALIAEAHRLSPNDGSITDSLGWAQFKRGKVEEAIATLQRAAQKEPSESEIHEHLGDALYTAGRKFEARHAWNAALITAGDDVRGRIEAKLQRGLNPANAAP